MIADKSSSPSGVWKRIPKAVHDQIIDLALERSELSPRELAARFTDVRRYFVSEATVYRLLKAYDLITSPAYVGVKAAGEFHTKTTRSNEMWQTDFTYFKIIVWGWMYYPRCSTTFRAHHRLEALQQYTRCTDASPNAGQDRTLAPDTQEPHPSGELLSTRRPRMPDQSVRRTLQPSVLNVLTTDSSDNLSRERNARILICDSLSLRLLQSLIKCRYAILKRQQRPPPILPIKIPTQRSA